MAVATRERVLVVAAALGELADARPGLRVPGTFDGFELAVRAVVGQQVSVRGVPNSPYVYDLVAPYPNRIPSRLHYQPRASQLATTNTESPSLNMG